MFCALLTSRYQVSVYRTNGPLVSIGQGQPTLQSMVGQNSDVNKGRN